MSKKSFGEWFWGEFKKFIAELSIKAKLILSFGFIIILIFLISTSTSNNTKPDEKQGALTMNSKSENSESSTISQADFDNLCNNIIQNTPDDNRLLAAAFYNVANDSARKKYYDTAIKLYNKSLQYVDNDPSVYNNMASSYKYLGEIEKAKSLYKKSLEIDPNYKNAYLQLAFLHALQHNKQEALKYFHIYEGKDPNARTRIKHSLELEVERGDVTLGGKELLEYIR